MAILSVLAYHYTARLSDVYLRMSGALAFKLDFGYLGVNLFFAISGFCIYLTIDRSGSIKEFFAKRFARLYPTYLVSVLFTFVIVMIFGLPGRESGLREFLGSLFFLNDFGIRWVDGVYWSLLVEIKYYILFASVYFVTSRYAVRLVLAVFFLSVILVVVSRLIEFHLLSAAVNFAFVPTYLPWFAIGAAYYMFHAGGRGGRPECYLSVLGVLVSALVYFPETVLYQLGALLVVFGLFSVLMRFSYVRIPLVFRFLGLVSYPLYLVHQYVGWIAIRELSAVITDSNLRVFFVFILVLLVAYAISVAVEFRFQKSFEDFFYSMVNGLGNVIFRGLRFVKS